MTQERRRVVNAATLPSAAHTARPWPTGHPLSRLLRRRARTRALDRDDHLDAGAISDWITRTEVTEDGYVAVCGHPLLDSEALGDLNAAANAGWTWSIAAAPSGHLNVTFARIRTGRTR